MRSAKKTTVEKYPIVKNQIIINPIYPSIKSCARHEFREKFMLKFIIKSSLANDDASFEITIEYPYRYSDEVYTNKEKWEKEQPQIAHLINSNLDMFFNGNILKKSDASCYIVLSSGKQEKLSDNFLLKDYSFHR